MSRIAYVNGRYRPHAHAAVHIEDRGYQFADGVYEVVLVHRGHMVDEEGHLDRLDRSLGEIRITPPMARAPMRAVMREVLRRNRIQNGFIYIQITRGVARRDHPFPKAVKPALVMTARTIKPFDLQAARTGVDAITIPDIRWKRCDIKTVGLLPNVLGKQRAREAGAYEAWMVDETGFVTEGTSSNAWIVTRDGDLLTRNLSGAILGGITRRAILDLAHAANVRFVERAFTVAEAKAAREAFVTSASSLVKPVVRIDGQSIGNGHIGEITERLLCLYAAHMDEAAKP
ncbi:MAG: D-amino-acid transaminase [Alphaproteobacteria bacterium]|nr:D-amino-acid transaminase [Alphaproteobacteria bacterium]